jgi:MFS family permease
MLSTSWYKIIGLSALQGAISLTWLVYNIYLPKLLIGFGFPPSLAIGLLVVENAIAVILEPLFGSLSDRAYRWIATKFGFVAFGVVLTSALTILIPTIFVFRNLFSAITWILPGVLIAWAMAMTVFRTPAISLIGRYAMASELPIAMSFLTLVGGFIGASKPASQNFILSLGAPIAFTIASVVLLAATALLRYFDPPITNNLAIAERKRGSELLGVRAVYLKLFPR